MGAHKIYSGIQGIRDNIWGSLYGDCHELLAKIQEQYFDTLQKSRFFISWATVPHLQVLCKWLATMVAWCIKTIDSWGIEVSEFTWFM